MLATETCNSAVPLVKPEFLGRFRFESVRQKLKPLVEVVNSGSKVLQVNPVILFLSLLFPFFLALTSDWIGLLVVFQAATAAICLRNAPATKALVADSAMKFSTNLVKGEPRAL
jgi:hypothetical protein